MDDIFEYPSDVAMVERTIPAEPDDRSERKIIIKHAQTSASNNAKQEFYYDKRTFDYNIMFMQIGTHTAHHHTNNFNRNTVNRNKNELQRRQERQNQPRKKPRQIQLSIQQESQVEKSHHNQELSLSNVLDHLNEEEDNAKQQSLKNQNEHKIEQQSKQPQQNKILQNNEEQSNFGKVIIDIKQEMEQNKKQSQISYRNVSQYTMNNITDKQSVKQSNSKENQQNSQIESSKIENFSYEFNNASVVSKNKIQQYVLNSNSQHFKQRENDLGEILNQLREMDSDDKEKQNNITEESRKERQNKIRELDALPFKLLYYDVKTENVQKLGLRSMIDFDFSILKLKPQPSLPYFKLDSKKITITQAETNTRWLVGKSKTQLRPLSISITCYSCSYKFKGVIKDGQCLAICGNKHCTKQVLVQINRVWLD